MRFSVSMMSGCNMSPSAVCDCKLPDLKRTAASACACEPVQRRKTVLVLDDDRTYLRVVERILSTRGYFVVATSDHQTFQERLEQTPVDLAVLDINMPEISGFDVYLELRKHCAVPVLFVTGYPRSFSAAVPVVRKMWGSHFSDGLTEILYKPFKMRDMQRKVAALIGE